MCTKCNDVYECSECPNERMLANGECLPCVDSVCLPMNYYISFGNSSDALTVAIDFPSSNLMLIMKQSKVQVLTFAGELYDL